MNKSKTSEILARIEDLRNKAQPKIPGYRIAEAIGQTAQWWSDIRNPNKGVKNIKADELLKIAELLGTSVNYLLTGAHDHWTASTSAESPTITMKGNSMDGLFSNGDELEVQEKEVDSVIRSGQPYVLILEKEPDDPVVCRLYREGDKFRVTFENAEEFNVPVDKVSKLYKVMGLRTFNVQKPAVRNATTQIIKTMDEWHDLINRLEEKDRQIALREEDKMHQSVMKDPGGTGTKYGQKRDADK